MSSSGGSGSIVADAIQDMEENGGPNILEIDAEEEAAEPDSSEQWAQAAGVERCSPLNVSGDVDNMTMEQLNRESFPCEHYFLDLGSELVCQECGYVGDRVFGDILESDEPPAQAPLPGRFGYLHSELAEVIMRMSEGDLATIHIDRTLDKLEEWTKHEDERVRKLLEGNMLRGQLSHALVVVALKEGLAHNGREERLDYVAHTMGVSMTFVHRALHLLRVDAVFLRSEVMLRRILNTLDLKQEFREVLFNAVLRSMDTLFDELDVLVASAGVALGRAIKNSLQYLKKNGDSKVWRLVRAKLLPEVRYTTAKNMTKCLQVSPSACRRVEADLSFDTWAYLSDYATALIRATEASI